MERILTNAQMREADLWTIEKIGISQDELVERAGKSLFEEINKRFMGGRVLVCVGAGNNGADGRVLARLLAKKHGFNVKIFNVENSLFKVFDNKFDIIVDCIFGTGLNREVQGRYKKTIEYINNSGSYVVSCDIPSGLNGDSGIPMGIAVKANLTIAIQELKLGHFLNDGRDYCGETICKDIGISIWSDNYATRLSINSVKKFFEPRNVNVHKGIYGRVCVVGGSKSMPGSVNLSYNALSSLLVGAGYSTIAFPESLYNAYAIANPECTVHTIKDNDGQIIFDKENIDGLLKYDSIGFGMGLGVSKEVYKVLSYLLLNYKGRLLIDADGLNCLAEFGLYVLKSATCQIVLTPHIGEFSRLVKKTSKEVLVDSINLAKNFAKEYNLTVVLKSATSIITNGNQVVINTTGCSGMAKGGSGDVLSGVLTGLLARKIDFYETCCVAPFVFGLAGEFAQNEKNEYSLIASDIVNNVPKAISFINSK